MAIIDMDGFETGVNLLPNVIVSGTVSTTTGRDGLGVAVAVSPNSFTRNFTAGSDTLYFHLGFRVVSNMFGQTSQTFAVIMFNADVNHLTLNVDGSGHLTLRRGTGSGTVIATSTQTFSASTAWYSFEGKVTVDDTTGECVVKVNGDTWINFTGDTRNAGTLTRLSSAVMGGNSFIDDWLCLDTTGAANNTWPGEVSVVGLRAANNGTFSALMGSDGNNANNYQQVDDYPFNTTDYNGAATNGARDSYDMTAVAKNGVVLAVQSLPFAAKSDAGAKSFKHLMRATSGSIVSSADTALSTTYLTYAGPLWTTDANGSAWTVAQVDAHEFGFEVV